jgi:signal peptidase I
VTTPESLKKEKPGKGQPKKDLRRLVWEYAEAIVTALLLALLIRAFVVQAFKIPSSSMETTLLVGDHLLVNKFIYGTKLPFMKDRILIWKTPQRGDIIVFRYPQDPKRDFIKRIVGVGGDLVMGVNKEVYVNGKRMDEPYARHVESGIKPRDMEPRDSFGPVVVPKGKLFVMGDNRDRSYDSRFWGFVDLDDIRGKAFIIYWSWNGEKHLPRLGRMGDLVH